eukprot:5545483-Amphidinium_carterae.1
MARIKHVSVLSVLWLFSLYDIFKNALVLAFDCEPIPFKFVVHGPLRVAQQQPRFWAVLCHLADWTDSMRIWWSC